MGISEDNTAPILSAPLDGDLTFNPFSQDDWVITYFAGDGTSDYPLEMLFEINSGALVGSTATDLQLELDVRAVPIPPAILLLTSGLIGLLGFRKLRNR